MNENDLRMVKPVLQLNYNRKYHHAVYALAKQSVIPVVLLFLRALITRFKINEPWQTHSSIVESQRQSAEFRKYITSPKKILSKKSDFLILPHVCKRLVL